MVQFVDHFDILSNTIVVLVVFHAGIASTGSRVSEIGICLIPKGDNVPSRQLGCLYRWSEICVKLKCGLTMIEIEVVHCHMYI